MAALLRKVSKAPENAPQKSTVESILNRAAKGGERLVSLLSGILAAFLILYSGYVLYDTFYTQNQAFSNSLDLLQYRPEILDDDPAPTDGAESLAAINADYRAWLTLYDTEIDYPVLQGKDDLYYASHDVFGNSSLTGSIYMAAHNSEDLSDRYNMIYGHHMDNGAMFGVLDRFEDEDYFDSHREGILISGSAIYDLKVFAVSYTDAYESKIYDVGNRDLSEILDYLGENALYLDSDIARNANQILALSTCASASTNGRLVVFAVMERRLVSLSTTGYEGVYDARSHPVSATVSIPEGTVVEYSTDDGVTWTKIPPEIKDVGEIRVLVRASHSLYGVVTEETTLRVTPARVTVRVDPAGKPYGKEDPSFTATVDGVIDGAPIAYTIVRPGAGTMEAVGDYTGAIIPMGEVLQGNYEVTFVAGDFSITLTGKLILKARGYEGVFDAQPHTVTAGVNIPDGTAIMYSIDGGRTWQTEAPSITNVGEITVLVRATNPNYESVTDTVRLRITPAPVTVKAKDAGKVFGSDDPAFTAQVSGLLDDTVIVYTVTRPGVGEDEAMGFYAGAIIPEGEQRQGNYIVTFAAGDFTITAAEIPWEPEPPTTERTDAPFPTEPLDWLTPTGSSYGGRAWALVNLIAMIVTIYLLLPLLHLKEKFSRIKAMRKINDQKIAMKDAPFLEEKEQREWERIQALAFERRGHNAETGSALSDDEIADAVDTLYYHVKHFANQFRFAVLLELVLSAAAVVAFILTEDMRLPMILIDKWTPLMLLLLLLCWIVDVTMARYRSKVLAEEEKEEQRYMEQTETVGV